MIFVILHRVILYNFNRETSNTTDRRFYYTRRYTEKVNRAIRVHDEYLIFHKLINYLQ